MSAMKAPNAAPQPKTLEAHGHERIDNYFWLKERENPEVIAYLEAENSYTEAKMKHTEPLQETLFNEIVGRIKKDDSSVPYFERGYHYYTRYEAGKEYPIYCRKPGSMDAKEEVMLDVNELAEGHSYYKVGGLSISDDNNLLAFGVDSVSRRQYTIHVKNLTTGEIYKDRITNTTGSTAWAADNKTFFYTSKDHTLRAYKISRHTLGETDDTVVYEEDDATFYSYVYLSKSRKYLFIASFSTLSHEYRFLDASDPNGKFKLVQPRTANLEYDVWHYGDNFYILTNDKAKNFRLMRTPISRPGIENWQEIIAHREDVLLSDIDIFKNFLVLSERKGGLRQLRIMEQNSKKEHYMAFDEPAYYAATTTNVDFDTEKLRYRYSSLTTPMTTYEYDMRTKEKAVLKQTEVLGGFDASQYVTSRLEATATDGTKIPISLVHRKDVKRDGKNPLLLYGYGSYGSSMEAYFRNTVVSLLDRGFVFAIAHIRGGQEMGRDWYENGKLLKKVNTFTDFIDSGDFLVKQNYCAPDKLFGLGGSAGGLLIGAVINMRPDLFNGVIAAVPFVDVVTTMLDEDIPLTTGEYDEWGNPNVKEYYEYMLSYSPYDNVTAKEYPNLLVTTGLHDSQVQYWEPAKWVAKLRELKTDDNILLLNTEMDAGHGGASGRFEVYRETALEYAFLLDLAGIEE